MVINGRTKVYGIIGNPVTHSLSPLMHNQAFADCDEDRVYVPLLTDDLQAALHGMREMHIEGASVTIPYKEQVLGLLDDVDPVQIAIQPLLYLPLGASRRKGHPDQHHGQSHQQGEGERRPEEPTGLYQTACVHGPTPQYPRCGG